MRIIRYKIQEAVEEKIKITANSVRCEADLALDIYALMRLRGHGVPSKNRIPVLVQHLHDKHGMRELHAKIFISKRVQLLRKVVRMGYFIALASLPDPVEALETFLAKLFQLGAKVQQAQCTACQFRSKCQFGLDFSSTYTDITKVLDRDYKTKVHEDCPHMPEIELHNQLDEVIGTINNTTQQDPEEVETLASQATDSQYGSPKGEDEEMRKAVEAAQNAGNQPLNEDDSEVPPGEEGNFVPSTHGGGSRNQGHASFTGSYYVKTQENLIKKIEKAGFAVFEIGRVMDKLLKAGLGTSFKPVPHQGQKTETENMKSLSDITKVEAHQNALPDEVHDAKLMKKELTIKQEKDPEERRQLLYVLIDHSGSMRTQYLKGAADRMTRAALTTALTIALSKKLQQDKAIMFVRFYAGSPMPLSKHVTDDQYKALMKKMRRADYNGGGTNIKNAVVAAVSDIKTANKNEDLAKATILLITDCEDRVDLSRSDLKGIELHTLDIAGDSSSWRSGQGLNAAGGVHARLKKVSDVYYKTDPTCVNVRDLLTVV